MTNYSPQTEQPQIPYPPQAYYATQEEFQRRQDEDNLRLLSIFHYVLGGLTILGASIFIFHFGMGLAMLLNPSWMAGKNNDTPSAFVGWMFMLMGGGAVLLGWTLGILTIRAGTLSGTTQISQLRFYDGLLELFARSNGNRAWHLHNNRSQPTVG